MAAADIVVNTSTLDEVELNYSNDFEVTVRNNTGVEVSLSSQGPAGPQGEIGDVTPAALQALADAQAAEAAAKTAQTAAETAETGAAGSASAAATSESNAAGSATTAGNKAANALASQNAAKTSETNAKTSETNAKTSETNAANSASAAATSKTGADTAKSGADAAKAAAETARDAAQTAQTDAEAARDDAEGSANAASTSETNARASESNAATSEDNAKTSETNAGTAKTAAETARDVALQAKIGALAAQTDAETARDDAVTQKTAATDAATEAGSARDAAQAAQSAAESAQTAAETAQGLAEQSATNAAASEAAAAASAEAAASIGPENYIRRENNGSDFTDANATRQNLGAAPLEHTHPVTDIVGLEGALENMFASPTFTGTPTAPTAAPGTNDTQIATTGFVRGELNSLVNGAPAALDTLKEISDKLANDESAVTALTSVVSGKQANLGFTPVQQGTGPSQTTNTIAIGYSTAHTLRVAVGATDFADVWPININGNAATATAATDSNSVGGKTLADIQAMIAAATPTNVMPKSGGQFSGGISFVNNVASSPTDLTKHIALWGTNFGFSITSGTLNYVSNSNHDFYSGSTKVVSVTATGMAIAGTLATSGNIQITGTSPQVLLTNSNNSKTRYLYHDGTNIGFLGSTGSWLFRTDDTGALWCSQLGDINGRIENRAIAWANDRVSQISFRRTGLSSTGGTTDTSLSGPYVVCGYSRESGNAGQVASLYYTILQGYDPVRGWWNIGVS
jgi:hypothetical protein